MRDKIPFLASGLRFEKVSREEACRLLVDKLFEEAEEFRKSSNPEELADLLEVIEALGQCLGLKWEELMEIKERKRRERGGFEKGWVLVGG